MQRFESCRPKQPVRSPPANVPRPLKTTRYRGISRIWLGLRVGNYATEVLFQALVSEAIFWCLVLPDPLSGAVLASDRAAPVGETDVPRPVTSLMGRCSSGLPASVQTSSREE